MASGSGTSKKRDFPALTGVRAVAAYMVYFHHFPQYSFFGVATPPLILHLLNEGHNGVTMFFVLSGFLITYRYYDSARLEAKWLKDYFIRRFARIYPVYFILTLAMIQRPYAVSLTDIVTNLTLTRGLFESLHLSGSGGLPQAWTLTVEECFYLFAPLLFYFTRKGKAWIAMAAVPILGVALSQLKLPGGLMGDLLFVSHYTFFGRCQEFFIGMGIAMLLRRGKLRPVYFHGVPVLTAVGALSSFGILLVFATFGTAPGLFSAVAGPQYGDMTLLQHLLQLYVEPACFGILYAGLITESSWIQKTLSTRLFVLLGQSSYCFYLIHFGIFADLLMLWNGRDPLFLFVSLVISSVIVFRLVEEPLNHWLRGFAAREPRRAPMRRRSLPA